MGEHLVTATGPDEEGTTESSPYDSRPTSSYSSRSSGPDSDSTMPTAVATPLVPSSEIPAEEESASESTSGSRSRSERRGHARPKPTGPIARRPTLGSEQERPQQRPRSVTFVEDKSGAKAKSSTAVKKQQDVLARSLKGMCVFGTSCIAWFLEVCAGTA